MPRPDPDHDIWDFSARSLAGLNGLAPSSRGPQLAALEAIARRSTQVLTAETMPWHRLRRPHVLKIRSLLEENYPSWSPGSRRVSGAHLRSTVDWIGSNCDSKEREGR